MRFLQSIGAVAMVLNALCDSAIAQVTILPDATRTVSVTGRGSVTAAPDTASAEVGVSVVDPDARRAKAAVDASVAKIVSLARSLGIADESVTTTAVNIEPRYDENNPARLRGYEVAQSVTVVVKDLAKLDSFLDGAVQAGANRNFDVSLTSSRETALKRQALTLALQAAKEQAEAAAQQLGVRLGGVRNINLNPTSGYSAVSSARVAVAQGARFLPGTIKIDADVSVVFLIDVASK